MTWAFSTAIPATPGYTTRVLAPPPGNDALHSAQLGFFSPRRARDALADVMQVSFRASGRIADGLKDHDVKLDLWDVVAMNAFAELPDYYVPWLDEQTRSVRPVWSRTLQRVQQRWWTEEDSVESSWPQQLLLNGNLCRKRALAGELFLIWCRGAAIGF